MRIIGGQYKGLRIPMPSSGTIRPTTDRSRESLFNILVHSIDLSEMSVLDLFGGSGAMSIEFASRGVKHVDCVELNSRVCKSLRELLKQHHINEVDIVQKDVLKFIQNRGQSYDIIFADPPYQLNVVSQMPDLILKSDCLKDGGMFILEHEKNIQFPQEILHDQRVYGQSVFSFFTK